MRFLPALLLVLIFAPFPLLAADIGPDLRSALAESPPGTSLPVVISFSDSADLRVFASQAPTQRRTGVVKALRATAERSQRSVRTLLEERALPYRTLWIRNALALQADADLLAQLAARPELIAIHLDVTLTRSPAVPSQVGAVESNIGTINAPALWERGVTGGGATVAILDSGVDGTHPDLEGRWRGNAADWFNPYAEPGGEELCSSGLPCTPCESSADFPCDDVTGDDVGHGTAVAGVALGGSASGAAIGAAPGALWIAAKIFDDEDVAPISVISAALQWALDPDGDPATDDAPDVVNGSWGFEEEINVCGDSGFREEVRALRAAGIAAVFASGNFFDPESPEAAAPGDSSISPANYPESFAVGATDPLNNLAPFSNRGPSACDGTIYPEVVAPGVHIFTALPAALGGADPYVSLSGTSFSAPHVSGVMALLRGAFPALTPERMEQALIASATDLGPEGPDNGYGYGLIDALGAYEALFPAPPRLLSPAQGATVSQPVTLRWEQPVDSVSGVIDHRLLVGRSPESLQPVQTASAAPPASSGALLSGAGGALLMASLFGFGFSRRRRCVLVVLAGALLILSACGGGDGNGAEAPPVQEPLPDVGSNTIEWTVEDLQPDTRYFWQVVAVNDLGVETESEVGSFRTAP